VAPERFIDNEKNKLGTITLVKEQLVARLMTMSRLDAARGAHISATRMVSVAKIVAV
jgi:hypothetical protein